MRAGMFPIIAIFEKDFVIAAKYNFWQVWAEKKDEIWKIYPKTSFTHFFTECCNATSITCTAY